LIDNLGGAVRKLTNVVSFHSENGTKVAKLAKDFDIPTTTLTAAWTNKDKIISHFFLSEYARKHCTVSGNSNQKTLLSLAGLWL